VASTVTEEASTITESSTVIEYVTVTDAAHEATSSAITVDPITPSETATASASATITYPAGNDTIPGPTGTAAPAPRCLTEEDAQAFAGVFQGLISQYTDELAEGALTPDFIDWSSSVNLLMNKGGQFPKNITGPTFANRQAFLDGQGSQPLIPFQILNVFHGCDSVSVRWLTTDSAAGKPTRSATVPAIGNGIMSIVHTGDSIYNGYRIKELFSEWNTGAWLVNLGWYDPVGEVDWIVAPNATNTTTKRDVAHADARPWQNMI
jgi:hypothetical protein